MNGCSMCQLSIDLWSIVFHLYGVVASLPVGACKWCWLQILLLFVSSQLGREGQAPFTPCIVMELGIGHTNMYLLVHMNIRYKPSMCTLLLKPLVFLLESRLSNIWLVKFCHESVSWEGLTKAFSLLYLNQSFENCQFKSTNRKDVIFGEALRFDQDNIS